MTLTKTRPQRSVGKGSPRGGFTQIEHEMSLFVMGISASAYVVYTVLRMHTRSDRREAWPSQETLAAKAGCSTRTVTRAVAALSKAGVIDVQERWVPSGWQRVHKQDPSLIAGARGRKHGKQISNVYTVRQSVAEVRAELKRRKKMAPKSRSQSVQPSAAPVDPVSVEVEGQFGPGFEDRGQSVSPSEDRGQFVRPNEDNLSDHIRTNWRTKNIQVEEDQGEGDAHVSVSDDRYRPENPREEYVPHRMSSSEIERQAGRFTAKPHAAKCPEHEGQGWVSVPCRDCAEVKNQAKYLVERQAGRDADARQARRMMISHCSLCNSHGMHETHYRDGAPLSVQCPHDPDELGGRLMQVQDARDRSLSEEADRQSRAQESRSARRALIDGLNLPRRGSVRPPEGR